MLVTLNPVLNKTAEVTFIKNTAHEREDYVAHLSYISLIKRDTSILWLSPLPQSNVCLSHIMGQ